MPTGKKILLLLDWFDPAYKAGGPIRSAVNFAKQMQSDFDIFVFTGDRDLNEIKPLKDVVIDKWVEYAPGVKVFYASPQKQKLTDIKEHISNISPDFIYLNSMFSKKFTVYPLWLKRGNRIPAKIVLAPRGMLKGSALEFRKRKKKIFLALFKWMKIPQLVTFHATDDRERTDIERQFGKNGNVKTVANFPGSQDQLVFPISKEPGFLDIVFIGRIHPIKGLDILLSCLKTVKQHVNLSIVGSTEDPGYRIFCTNLIKDLPTHVTVKFLEDVPHHRINQIIRYHHLFCLPTKGENFGHAIFESLAVGRPVLISDQTPWRQLQYHKAGWDLPLNNPAEFSAIIERFALMDAKELNKWCSGAWQFCNEYLQRTNIKQQYFKLFS